VVSNFQHISGIYTTYFSDYPPSFYNFKGDEFLENIELTVRGTKAKAGVELWRGSGDSFSRD